MRIEKSLIGYSLLTCLCGIISFLVLGTAWYFISGVNNIAFLMAGLPFVGCWCVAGIVAWMVSRTTARLAISTYLMAAILFGGICLVTCYMMDSSVKAWLLVAIIGFFICSFPSYLLLKLLGIPLIINRQDQNNISQKK